MDCSDRRMQAAISRTTASHMSNAKWKKLFDTLAPLALVAVRWKFLRDDRIFEGRLSPREGSYMETGFGDVLPSPYGAYREIEWLEFAEEDAERVSLALQRIGHFPLSRTADGVRIVAYRLPVVS